MLFEAVPEFLAVYETLVGRELEAANHLLERLSARHESTWARQGSIRGERRAWIVLDREWRLYWDCLDSERILLLALIRRR